MTDSNHFWGTSDPENPGAGLIGPPHAENANSMVGVPELTQEEKDKLHAALLEKKELGLYSEKDLVEVAGRKVIVDQGNFNLALDPQSGTPMVKDASGNWLSPSDKDYDRTLLTVATKGDAKTLSAQDTPDEKGHTKAEKDEHQALVNDITTMVNIDAGSMDPHLFMDNKAMQRIREGASTMELKTLKPIVAAVDKFAMSGVADVNPEQLGQMHAPPVVPGAAYDAAMRNKAKRNEEFIASQIAREKDKDKS